MKSNHQLIDVTLNPRQIAKLKEGRSVSKTVGKCGNKVTLKIKQNLIGNITHAVQKAAVSNFIKRMK